MMLDMLHNEIQLLVGRAEAHKLGPHNARRLMSLVNQMANAERAQGVAQGRAEEREETKQRFE